MSFDHECHISIGDWSEDGHNQWEVLRYRSNISVEKQQQAYRESVAKTGMAFHGANSSRDDPNVLCAHYEDDAVHPYHIEIFRRWGIDNHIAGNIGPAGGYPNAKQFATMILWFIGLSLSDFETTDFEKVKAKRWIKDEDGHHMSTSEWLEESQGMRLNGWWGPLNIGFGYGIFQSKRLARYNDDPYAGPVSRGKLPQPIKNVTLVGGNAIRRLRGHDLQFFKHDIALPKEFRSTWSNKFFENWSKEQRAFFSGSSPCELENTTHYENLIERLFTCKGEVLLTYGRVLFERGEDATLFKMFSPRTTEFDD